MMLANDSIRCMETILKHSMTSQEARAFKVQCIFIDQTYRVFPNMRKIRGISHTKGDPRKTFLFKICYKLLRTTQHKIKDIEYPLYVRSQLDIIKINAQKYGKEPNISPNCLVGEKAWKRWLVWKKIYEAHLNKKVNTAKEAGVDINKKEYVINCLKSDKKFLTKKLKSITKEKINKSVTDRNTMRWIATKQLSPYYALICPILNKWLEEKNLKVDDILHLDLSLYRPGITKEIKDYFSDEFYEF